MLQYDKKKKQNHKAMKIAACLGSSNAAQLVGHYFVHKETQIPLAMTCLY